MLAVELEQGKPVPVAASTDVAAAAPPISVSAVSTVLPTNNMNTAKKPLIVIIRHGKTEYNKLGIFTGQRTTF